MKQSKITCDQCKNGFIRRNCVINSKHNFCSHRCWYDYRMKTSTIESICPICNKSVMRVRKEVNKSKSGFIFCSQSCAAKYNNANRKSSGTRSKIEIQFGEALQKLFPQLEFLFNNKIEGYELDIYIPKLKLAIEWNGKIHYQPIYGQEKLDKIQYRDYKKQLICQRENIDLIVIADYTSKQKFLNQTIDEISRIISNKIAENGL